MKRNIFLYGVVVFFILTILSILFKYPQDVTSASEGCCALFTIVSLYIINKTTN